MASDDVGLGRRIHNMRKARGLTQRDVAKLAGVTAGAVNRWELGIHRNMRPHTLFALADAFGVDARWLALGEASRTTMHGSDSRLHAIVSRLTDQQAKSLARAIEALAPVAPPARSDDMESFEPGEPRLVASMNDRLVPVR